MTARDGLTDHTTRSHNGQLLSRALALVLVVFGFFPVANWIRGGHTAPWYGEVLETWLSGTVIVVGIAIVLIVVSRRRALSATSRLSDRASRWFDEGPQRATAVISIVATLLYASVALLVFDGRPLFIDEVVQMYQARLLAAGHLTDYVGPFPEFFGALNVVSLTDRQFGQFPPGGPAHLMLGVLVGAPWLITPLIGGAVVYVFALLVRRIEPEAPIALAATLLVAFSPFMIFMSASHMNHAPTLLWILIAWFACVRLTSDAASPWRWALVFGFAAGVAATIRPVDAVAMTAPAFALSMFVIRERKGTTKTLATMCAGAALPAALLLAFNYLTTGSSFLFGYELMWGRSHSLGFHDSPWGIAHSPARGLELLSLYTLRLQSYLFETPSPSLIPVIATLVVAHSVTRFDRAMLWSMILLAVAYFAYWHDGFYLGPRFFFVLVPVLALLAARAPRALGHITGSSRVRRVTAFGLATAILLGICTGAPERAQYYARSLSNSRHHLTAPVEALGVRNALVFVRESWGSQVMARLWGRHITRREAEVLYRSVDTCVLDSALMMLERGDVRSHAARAALWPLLRDSAHVRPSELSPDQTERVLPGSSYPPHCLERIADDHRGVALYPLVLAEPRTSNIFARDLGERNAVLAREYPSRATYLLALTDSGYVLQPLLIQALAVQ